MIQSTSQKSKQTVVYVYLLLMSSLFLFFFQNYYFNLTYAKYRCFFYITAIAIIAYILCTIWGIFQRDSQGNNSIKAVFTALRKDFSLTDYAMLALVFSHTVTTILSIHPQASFDGSMGRHLGLLFTYMIAFVYFMISRSYALQQSVILVLLGSVSLVYILGLANFFYLDPLGFYSLLSDYQANLYLSTIGNIDFYGILICFSLPLSMILYCYCQERLSKAVYLFTLLCSGFGLITCNSDSAFVAMMLCLLLCAILAAKDYQAWMRFLQGCLVLFIGMRILYYLVEISEYSHTLHTLSYQFSGGMGNLLALGFCILSYLYCYTERSFFTEHWNGKRIQRILITLAGIVMVLTLLIVCYFTFIDTTTSLGRLENYLRFSASWGTGRGETWMTLWKEYKGFSFLQRLFGYGLDMTADLTASLSSALIFDNAHNEYLQYLITSGILGLSCYLLFGFSVIVRLYRISKEEPFGIAIMVILISYMVQACFNLNQPMTTPLLFIFFAIGEAFCRMMKKEQTNTSQNNSQ